MAGIKIAAFAGIVPRTSDTLLKDNEAQKASNTKLYSGELRSWYKPGQMPVRAFARPDAQTIYKQLKASGDAIWLSWTEDVNAVPGPIYALDEYPTYYTGSGTPKKTNSTLAAVGDGPFYPGDFLEMGVIAPTSAPTVSASGGSGTAETRVYLYSFISLFGTIEEESAPSPASSVVSVLPGGSVTVGGLPSAPAGKYNITKIRIYRSVTGTSSNPFLKVADVAIGTASYVDTVAALGLGQRLPSVRYDAPPSDLQGLVSMANGILAGFRGSEVYFCEPFLPHAWPAQYALTVEFPIVGLAAFGESLVVATRGNPFVITGSTPAGMSQAKLPIYEPCISKRSIASDEGGALYASPNGVVKISQGFAGISTRALFTRAEWQVYRPESMLGAVLDGRYYLFCDSPSNGFVGALILDRNEAASPMTTTTMFTTAAYPEPTSAALHVLESDEIKVWEGSVNEFLPFEWRSKTFILPRPVNFGAAQIEADFGDVRLSESLAEQLAALIAANQALFAVTTDFQSTVGMNGPISSGLVAGSVLTPLPPSNVDGRNLTLIVYAQGKQVALITVKNSLAIRLPSGFKADRWEFQLDGNVPVRHLKVAETSKELVSM
jgi:hypothetical protein